jgi:hypothetical protein
VDPNGAIRNPNSYVDRAPHATYKMTDIQPKPDRSGYQCKIGVSGCDDKGTATVQGPEVTAHGGLESTFLSFDRSLSCAFSRFLRCAVSILCVAQTLT